MKSKPGAARGCARPSLIRADVHPYGDTASLVVTPRGEIFKVEASPRELHRVLETCDGLRTITEVVADARVGEGYIEVLELLLAEGSLREGQATDRDADWARFAGSAPAAPPARQLLLIGDPGLVDRLEALITGPATLRLLADDPAAEPRQVLARVTDPEATLVVAVRQRFDRDWLAAMDAVLQDAGVRWTQFHLDGGKAFFGPAIVPGKTANYRDLLARRRCAIDETAVFDALTAPAYGTSYRPPTAELDWLLASFATDLDRLSAGAPCRTLSTEVEADPVALELRAHWVLPLPDRSLTGDLLVSGPRDTRLLVGERCGIIQRARVIAHHPAVPERLKTVQTHNANMGRIDAEWANDIICGGSAFDDHEGALQSAIGESVERYCGNYMGQNELRWASYDELIGEGEHAVNPHKLVLYSERMYDTPGSPYVRFTRDLQVRWVKGRSLTYDRDVWLPVTLAYVNWLAGELDRHPITNYMNFSGVAAGLSLEHALVSGIEELIERDATMVWWMNAQPLPAVRLTPEMAALWGGAPAAAGQIGSLVHLDNQFDIPVMAGIVRNTAEGWLNIGFAARPEPETAALKAWTEGLTLQEGSRDLAVRDSLIRQAVDWGFASYAGLKAWREDRRYLDDYRADFRDVSDLMCQQQIFLDPRAVEAVAPWTDLPATRDFTDLPRLRDRSLATYRSRIESHGFEICYVDLTTIDVAAAGMHATRVIIPGLVPNFPAAFPMLGTGRIQQVPVDLGWRETRPAEDGLSYWPLPHA